jgi:hypothetical protein
MGQTNNQNRSRKTFKVWGAILCLAVFLILGRVFAVGLPQNCWAQESRTDAVVLVNSDSEWFSDFETLIQPYLDHFGIPYTLIDISVETVPTDIGDYAVIIIGHRRFDVADTLIDTEEDLISAAVNTGTGFVNFDNDLSGDGSTFQYDFIQDIFGFDYISASSGSGVTFTSETGGGLQINCWEDDHQDPVLTTFTDPSLFVDTDGQWDEFHWNQRDYPAVFAGIPEATDGSLETIHFFGEVPNGTYRVIANLYHSRDWRYHWGYTSEDPRTHSYDVTSGPSGDFAEFELDTVEITNGRFDLYTNYGEDLGGTAFEYFGWAWIRLVPVDAPPAEMHYITDRHQAGESISTGSMWMAGITLPEGVTALAMTGSQPFLSITEYGSGRAVQWGSYDWMSHSVKGPVYGLDDLVWRSIVWAARKPFVMQGMPPFVTMRVDDESGPFWWIHIANEFGIKPWAGLFYHNVDATEAADLSALVNDGMATASVHAKSGTFFYYNHGVGDFSDEVVAANYEEATLWHENNNIPISKFVLPHYYEFGTNVFQGLSDWGVEFVGTMMEPGNGYGAPWIMNGPYRLYETGGSSGGRPVYYADFMSIPEHPEFEGQFFNCVTEIRDDAGYEWYPDNDVAGTVGRGTRQTKRALDSMALATLFTHGYYTAGITPDNWRAILHGITDNLAPYNPEYVTMDYACQYVRALATSNIQTGTYDPETRQVEIGMLGGTDMQTRFHIFTEQDGDIASMMLDIPAFSAPTSATTYAYTLPGQLDHIVVTPASATVATGGTQQFSAQGYDADDNPIPNLPFEWNATGVEGTINSTGLFTAGSAAGSGTVEASYGGVIGSADLEVIEPELDHFTFDPISSPQYVTIPFNVSIEAKDVSGNLLVGYDDTVSLTASSSAVLPTSVTFSGGVWSGQIRIEDTGHDIVLTATAGDAVSNSDPFEVQMMPMFYQVTSDSYEQLQDVPFVVTVTAYQGTTVNLWEDEHQDPVLETFTDHTLLNDHDGLWDEFWYQTGRPFPAIFAGHNEWEDNGLQPMHFAAVGIPDGEYQVWANLYTGRQTRHYYGFTEAEALAGTRWVDNVAGAGGSEQFDEYLLGTVQVEGGRFDLWAGDGDSSSPYFYGWAWIRLVPVDPGIIINLWEDDHQEPDLVTTTDPGPVDDIDGQWTEFHYVSGGRPFPSVMAHHNEYESTFGLPLMVSSASDIPEGEYEVFANLYDNAPMRYFYAFDATDPFTSHVDTVGGAPDTEHREYSLGTVEIASDGIFNLFVQDADILAGTYPVFGWAWIRLVPTGITMTSSPSSVVFDADGNGTFDEPGDKIKELVDGSFTIMAKGTAGGSDIEIMATDVLGRFGYNTYTIESVNQPPVANAGNTVSDWEVDLEGCSAEVTLDGSLCYDPDGDGLTYSWTWSGGSASGVRPTIELPLGTTTIILVVNDGSLDSVPDTIDIIVEDTTPPYFTALANPDTLWPPNHRMVPISISVEGSDNCDPEPVCEIVSVSSDEPADGPGDGHTLQDWEITGNLTVNLRAERSGLGDGRLYTITVECTDASGNSSEKNAVVTVPHDSGKKKGKGKGKK